MKPKPLLIKFDDLPGKLAAEYGNYDTIFTQAMGLNKDDWLVVDPLKGESFPEVSDCSGVVISGAPAMITENFDWSLRTQSWITEVLSGGVPVLGVCYGHHIVAQALGGSVDWSENGVECGVVQVEMTAEAAHDPLFADLPIVAEFLTHHRQVINKPPPGAVELAGNPHSAFQAFSFGDRVWSVQFHPELPPGLCGAMIDYDLAEGRLTEEEAAGIKSALKPTPDGPLLLQGFVRVLLGSD